MEFEKYSELSFHIQRMAATGSTGNTLEWSNFINELNVALENKLSDLEIVQKALGLSDCKLEFDKECGWWIMSPWISQSFSGVGIESMIAWAKKTIEGVE